MPLSDREEGLLLANIRGSLVLGSHPQQNGHSVERWTTVAYDVLMAPATIHCFPLSTPCCCSAPSLGPTTLFATTSPVRMVERVLVLQGTDRALHPPYDFVVIPFSTGAFAYANHWPVIESTITESHTDSHDHTPHPQENAVESQTSIDG